MTQVQPGALARHRRAGAAGGIAIRPGGPVDLATGAIIQRFVALDKYAEEGAVIPQGLPTLGKISAGYKETYVKDGVEHTKPIPSRDGTIYLSDPEGRCPTLAAALHAADLARREGGKPDGAIKGSMRLSIALPFDELDSNLTQAFFRYSSGRLEVHGDLHQLTEMVVTEWRTTRSGREPAKVERHTYYPGQDSKTIEDSDGEVREERCDPRAYARLRRTCSVVWNLLFTLGEWVGEGEDAYAKPNLDDGLGVYRLTSTSRYGLMDIGQYLQLVSGLCHGQLRGAVLELLLTYPSVTDSLSVRRNEVPRWALVFRPPKGSRLDPGRWRELASRMLAEGAMLSLPKPQPESWGEVERDMQDLVEPDADVLDQLLSGDLPARGQAQFWAREWFGRLQDSPLGDRKDRTRRVQFIREKTDGRANGLEEAIQVLSNAEMQELVTAAIEWDAQQRLAQQVIVPKPDDRASEAELTELRRKAAEYDRIYAHQFGDEDDTGDEDVPDRPVPAGVVGGPQIQASGTVEPPPPDGDDGHAAARSVGAQQSQVDEALPPASSADQRTSSADPSPAGEEPGSPDKLEAYLLQALRPVADSSEQVFTCAECGRQVVSVGVENEGDVPARTWLKRLAAQGIDQPLCLDDARTAVLRKRNSTRRRASA